MNDLSHYADFSFHPFSPCSILRRNMPSCCFVI